MGEGCTGLAATWCPNCGDCSCVRNDDGYSDLSTPDCPIHGEATQHAPDDETERDARHPAPRADVEALVETILQDAPVLRSLGMSKSADAWEDLANRVKDAALARVREASE